MPIEVHHLSEDPTAAWKAISTEKSQRVIKIAMRSPNAIVPDNKVRIVCMSGKDVKWYTREVYLNENIRSIVDNRHSQFNTVH